MRIAIAGLRHGHIYALYDMAQRNPEVSVAGFWEEDAAARAEARLRIAEREYPSYEALLADASVDIVAVGDYYGVRGARVLAALRAGKHVLADKPLCTSLAELDAIARLAREKGLRVGCMLSLRYDGALRLARRLIGEGQIGEVRALTFTGQHPLDYGKRPAWYFEPGKHGGVFNDIAIHGVDAVAMVAGLRRVKPLCARQWNSFAAREPAFADCAQLLAEYENGAGLTADVSYSAPSPAAFRLPSYWRFTLWGAEGMLECRYGGGGVLLAQRGDQQPRLLPAPPVEDDELRELLRAIRGEECFLPPESVFVSSRAALDIQRFADERPA